MPLARRCELLKMRYDAKTEAITDLFTQEVVGLNTLMDRLENKDNKRIMQAEVRAKGSKSVSSHPVI
jgi:hypothetical protein